ncbi:hypothetical protein HMPREF1129_2772 [Actinomyces naeslundii str. Howell 279]|uniref:Uncharacterized protein n=1 Tax=Actinomyces naeslundii (strain ATCC 12104 / DSM 43013 / CCUG 2238 / JCM 8349 / NCTC 10301 / Howell 279) TaxID=1115803 RepID=J3JKV2_ACTNH|nr:hypothetical protein HMPREF1129_2772 [Actinomyces naeslundii str. Howell 279]
MECRNHLKAETVNMHRKKFWSLSMCRSSTWTIRSADPLA